MNALRLALVLLTAACGGAGARVEVPPAPAARCSVSDLDGEPLVVDLRADKRADLESALAHGIVALAYDCDGVRVLPECSAQGGYAYVGVTEKEQLVRLSDPAEIRANLLTNGATIDRDRRGRDVELAMAIAGRRTAERTRLTSADFTGRCTGATHYVRSVSVGAFALGFAGHGQSTIDSLFASGEAHDGSLQSCRAANASSDASPAGCSAPLRVVVEPIGAAPAEPARHCREGTVLTDDGECRSPNRITYHLCAPTDLADCEAQCQKGSMGSCAVAGRSYQIGRGVAADLPRAKQLLTRACDGGSAQGCHRLGEVRLAERAPDDARALFEKSCNSGWLEGCESLGQLGLAAPGAKVDVMTIFKRSCAGGNYDSCASLGKLYETGLGAPQNDAEAVRLYQRACDSGLTRRACVSLSVMVEKGRGTPADPARAIAILEKACNGGSSDSCGMLSLHYFEGRGVTRDSAKGVELLVRACEGDDKGSCLPLAMRYQAGIGVPRDTDRAHKYFTRACDAGITLACMQARTPPPK